MESQERNITVKTGLEVHRMRRPSRIIEELLWSLKEVIRPGVSTREIDRFCENFIAERNAVSSLKGYQGFPASICASPNNVAVHGIPNDNPLRDGDIVTIDVTLNVAGWHGDGAWTYLVGAGSPEKLFLLKAGMRMTNWPGLAARAGGRLGDVGAAIERTAGRLGCSVLEDFAGHGIGTSMHEDPIVANTGVKGSGRPIVPGMVFTIEPILCLGKPEVNLLEDGWTVVTRDGGPTAQFEHTLAVFRDRTEVLTLSSRDIRTIIDGPPYF